MEREEKGGRGRYQKYFPIAITPYKNIERWTLFDSDRGVDLAAYVREYYIPDFSKWKEYEHYSEAFDRLLRDLKSDKPRNHIGKHKDP